MSDIKMRVVNSTVGLGDSEYSLSDGAGMLKFDKAAMDECCEMINNHDKLISRVAELEFSLDDRDCYIADADMKNEELTKQVAELRAVVYEANKYLDINNLTTIGSGSNLHEWFKQALKESE